MQPDYSRMLIVSVDTEEEGLWSGGYRVQGNTTHNLRGLERFQQVCEEHAVPPTYLVDAPVLDDYEAVQNLSHWQSQNRCEVGAHCHAWCTPPILSHKVSSKETYLSNLPPEIQHQKLAWLTTAIEKAMGKRPTSYRAGRYGFDAVSAEILNDLGYVADSSVLPMHDYRSHGGPNYLEASRTPNRYFGAESGKQLWEIPITAGFSSGKYESRRMLWKRLRNPPWRQLRLAGVADRLGITRRVKLCPEGSNSKDLKRLVDRCYHDGLTVLVLMLHSSSLVKGCSPYVSTDRHLESMYDRLIATIQHAVITYGYRPITLSQAASKLVALPSNPTTESLPSKPGNSIH